MNMNDMDADGSWKHYKLEEFVDFVYFLLSFEGFRTPKRFLPLFSLLWTHRLNANMNA